VSSSRSHTYENARSRLLVDPKHRRTIEAILLGMGFYQRSVNSQHFMLHHHSMPFYHSKRDVLVEVHRGLFPSTSKLGHMPVFSLDNVKAQSKLSSFNNIPVMRLSPELQIVYTASHWGLELRRAGGVLELIDIIYLLARVPATRSMELNYALGKRLTGGGHASTCDTELLV
jgi:hypothetical protein